MPLATVQTVVNSPTALAMQPRPRNLTDATWQGSVDDAHIAKVIREGGASVGLSATMTFGWCTQRRAGRRLVQVVAVLKSNVSFSGLTRFPLQRGA